LALAEAQALADAQAAQTTPTEQTQ
jgi:hypothetical protein